MTTQVLDNTAIFRRTYGVEIEFIGRSGSRDDLAAEITRAGVPTRVMPLYPHTVPRGFWALKTDNSLRAAGGGYTERGWEMVSPPLSGEDGFQQIETVTAVLTRHGASINPSTGLHIHVDSRNPAMDLDALKRLAILYIENEPIFDRLNPPSRRGNDNHFLSSIAMRNPKTIMQARDIESIASILKFGNARHREYSRNHYDPRRYVKLNFVTSFYWHHGTVEFRHAAGSTDAAKIKKWVLLYLRLTEKAATATNTETVEHAVRTQRRARAGTKRAILIDMVLRPEGATTREVLAATGWGEVSVAGVAHQYGLNVRSERVWENHRRVLRYFGSLDPNAPATTTTTVRNIARFKATNITEMAEYLGMPDDERTYWEARDAMLNQPNLRNIVRAE